MEIKVEETNSKGAFFVEEADKRLAEMTFSKASDKLMIIDHTEVSDVLKGKNVGRQLVKAAVELARERKMKILPLCPFARAVFNKTPDYKDVLDV